WRVADAGYFYEFSNGDGRELLAYHWHPGAQNVVRSPHLHLGAASNVTPLLAGAHLPTGFISLPASIRMVITELGIEPRRADWDEVLTSSERLTQLERP
ncbi:MAG: hypothetical protein QOF51_2941, partial [Chloroflexota bacterium]|nr:hypothetical protein [Chloroflexota bacterium]